MKNIYAPLLIFTLFLSALIGHSQDPHFSQYYANRLFLNPAFAGASGGPDYQMSYRNQWPAVNNAYQTYYFSWDQEVDVVNGALGVQAISDRQMDGVLAQDQIGFIYTNVQRITRFTSVRFGAQIDLMQQRADLRDQGFGDMIDPNRGFIYGTSEQNLIQNYAGFDFSSGALVYNKNLFLGLSVNHIAGSAFNFEQVDDIKSPMKITLHGGGRFLIDNRLTEGRTYILPVFVLQNQQGHKNIILGTYLQKDDIIVGSWYRHSGSLVTLVGLSKGIFQIGYSYDLQLKRSMSGFGGAHELSLGITLDKQKSPRVFDVVECPKF